MTRSDLRLTRRAAACLALAVGLLLLCGGAEPSRDLPLPAR